MNTTMKHPAPKVAVLAAALAVTGGLGGIAQASSAFVVQAVVTTPALSPIEQLRRLTEETLPSAIELSKALRELYLALNDDSHDEEVDPAEYETMANTMRQHEAMMDGIMESSAEARDVLMPLRRAVAKARSNATIVVSLARQANGGRQTFKGHANLHGLARVARLSTEHLNNRFN